MSNTFTLKCQVDIKELESKLSESTLKRKRMDFADAVADKMEPYVPYKIGNLSSRGNRHIGDGEIIYTEGYAGYVYHMPTSNNFTKKPHPKATSHWDEKFTKAESAWIKEKAEKILTEGLS